MHNEVQWHSSLPCEVACCDPTVTVGHGKDGIELRVSNVSAQGWQRGANDEWKKSGIPPCESVVPQPCKT